MTTTITIILLSSAIVLFAIGLYGLMTKRNGVRIVMAIEILVAAANLTFIAFGFGGAPGFADPMAQTFVILSLSIGGAVVGVALALLINVHKRFGTIDLKELKTLKW